MNMLKRLSDLVRSNVNDVLDKAEDPRKILDQTILDMQEEHKKAKKMLLDTMTLLKQAEKQAEGYKKQATEWEAKAMAALKAGNDELARQALGEKQRVDTLVIEAETGSQGQKAQTDDLKKNLALLESKIEEAKKKKDELVARLNAADMKKKQAAIHSGEAGATAAVSDSSAFDTFERMVNKIENTEAEVEARRELMGSNAPEIEMELKKTLEKQTADEALAALKAKMTGSATPAATPAPAATDGKAAAIEDELDKLRKKLEGGT